MRHITFSYVLRRLGSALFTIWVALTINFALPRVMGGNPADYMASQSAMGSLEYAELLKEQFGLDKSIPEQYFIYLKELLHGNLGISFSTFPVPVSQIILKAIPWTLMIVLVSTFISFLFAWVVGTLAALKKGSIFDNVVVGIAFYIQSIPYFWAALLMMMGLAYYLDIFPMGHAMPPGLGDLTWYEKIPKIAYHAALPILSLVVITFAGRLIVLRSNVLQVFSEDYIMLAQAKGLKRRTILFKYAFRNALLPSFTGLMLSIGLAVGGALVTEMIFSYPGIGLTILNAIYSQDYPLIQGCFAIIAISVVTMNFLADLIYPLIDPRVVVS
ncbi:MAG: ABC transporter permease [Anaerolineales bacterium]|nr:ABC transporter permease [Anaerolineales bacterium]